LTLIFAHRGYSSQYPENTMLAFVEARNVGADGLELDVQMTKDGELVVIHDEKVDRTTDGKGFVKDFTAQELRKLDAGHQYKLSKKEKIPLLEEVFEWLRGNPMVCNVEFKNGLIPYNGMEEKVVSLVRQYQLEDKIIFSSFNHYSVVHSTSLAPEIETAPLLAEGLYMPWIYAKSIRSSGFHPNYRAAPDEIIKLAIEAGIAVRPYTVNKETEMERLIKVGCSAIITDDPLKGVKKRMEINKRS
jgi:glycerophosphoryl diester phosphodiesterase